MALTTIKLHPTLPFVEIGSSLDFGKRYGWDNHEAWSGSNDEWMYVIDGHPGGFISCSEEDARESAEEELFIRNPEWLESRVQELRAAGNLDVLLALTELKGFWRGKISAESRTREILKPVLEIISRVAA